MRKLMQAGIVVTAFALLGAGVVHANGQVELKATAHKHSQHLLADGSVETRLEPAATVTPGDTIAYTIEARNISADQTATRVVITDPIPEHTRYVDGSAEGEGTDILFSVDGGMRFDAATNLEVRGDNGTNRPAVASDYTHVRWVLRDPLAPSEKRSVRFLAELQ